jgi:hypothetical protein
LNGITRIPLSGASDTPVSEFAAVSETALGWMGGHLHEFDLAETTAAMRDTRPLC